MGLRLFDGSDSDNDNSKIEINQDYAKRFEHNQKRQDLQRLEELKKKGLIEDSESESSESESSSSEEEDSQNFRKDLEFFDALIKVKKKDPTLKQKEAKLFDSDDDSHAKESDDVKGSLTEKKKSSMYLKDVVAKHLIEEGPEFNDENTKNMKVYDKEQEEIRKAFLEAAEVQDENDEEELLKVKERGTVEEEKNEEFEKKLDEYFGDGDDQLDENSKFLKQYFKNKLWIGEDATVKEEELNMLSEDEEEIEKQEEYEYRFQESAEDTIWGHSRTIEGSVRKKKNSRKEQRKNKEERMEIARLEREEELKHLKNLKKEEVKQKLRKIRETAGLGEDENCLLDIKDLDDDFDPEEYDRMMKVAFSEKYYEKEDIDPGFGSDMDDEGNGEHEKPDFDKEDELLGLPKGWTSSESGDGFFAARERSLSHKIDNDMSNEDNEEDEEQGNEDEKGTRKRKRKLSLYQKAKEAMMEEYYKLDYEDTVGDLKTRFKYAKIQPNRYGLSTAEILAMDDKELNQFVSMKKLAPYKEEWKMPNSTRQRLKMRSRELLRGKLIQLRREEKRRWSRVAHRPTSFIQSFANQDKPLILPFRLPSKISHCFASNIPKSLSHPLPSPLPPPRLPLPTIRVSLTGFLPSHHPSWPPVSRSQGPSTAMAVLLEEILKSVELWLKLINKPEPFVDPNLDPVLLVPGVGGSILNAVNGDTGKEERVWVRIFGADSKLQTELWSFYDPASGESVCFDPKIKIRVPDERNGLYSIDTLDPDMIIGCDSIYYYHDMIVEMTKWGFQEGKTLFGFGYDFRQSNRLPETLDLLAAKLEAVYNASGGKKINLISHSMGGLLVKCFMGLRSKIFEKYVQNWIAIAAPFQGAPGYVTSTFVSGMSFVNGWRQNFFISKWSMHQLLIECPSIYELMGAPDFNWQHIPLLEVWREKHDKDGNPHNVLESYPLQESVEILTESLSTNKILHDGVDIPLPFNLDILKWANETREILKDAKLPPQVKFYNIYATGLETPHTVCYGDAENPVADLHKLRYIEPKYVYVDGDGTVPVESAMADGLDAVARVGVPGEHQSVLRDHRLFRSLKHWLKAGDPDPFYDPLNDYVILPTGFEIESHVEKGLEVAALKEEWEIISNDQNKPYELCNGKPMVSSITLSQVVGDCPSSRGEACATVIVHPQQDGKQHIELNALSVSVDA